MDQGARPSIKTCPIASTWTYVVEVAAAFIGILCCLRCVCCFPPFYFQDTPSKLPIENLG